MILNFFKSLCQLRRAGGSSASAVNVFKLFNNIFNFHTLCKFCNALSVAAATADENGLKTLVFEKGNTTGGAANMGMGPLGIGSRVQRQSMVALTPGEAFDRKLDSGYSFEFEEPTVIERGKGLGSAVIQDIVAKHKNEYDLIYCFVDAKNDGAIRLYKKLGKVYDEDGPNDNGEYYVTFYDNGNWELTEGKKSKKVVSVQSTAEPDLDSFLRELGLVPISMIAPACSDTSPSGATVWAPAEPHFGSSYKKAIPQFEVISAKRLPKLVATLDATEYPNKMFTTDDILNNGGRKLKEVRIGDVQNNPCRGLWFRTRSGDKRYFIFGSIFYKNTQKINALKLIYKPSN